LASSPIASQAFRDLQWVVESSPLLRESVHAATLQDVDLTRLVEWLRDRQTRQVGRYFEALVEFWLTEMRQVEMVERGLQVQEEKRTLGELDFVFRDAGGILTHWETAVKFYLHHEGNFIGPNAADTLDRKVTRLVGHQLPLGKKFLPEVRKSEGFVKGRLYYHPNDPTPKHLSEYVHPDHLRGTWILASELDWLDSQKHYHILEKPHWFTVPVVQTARRGCEVREYLAKHFVSSYQPIHLMDSKEEAIFVVSDKWPDQIYLNRK